MSPLNVPFARSQFPSLSTTTTTKPYIFADNAGGSQVPNTVISRITDYFSNTNVQLGADYSVSQVTTKRVLQEAPQHAKVLIGASHPDEIVFGASTTISLENLARGLEVGGTINAGDEFIVTGEHEANVGPWKKLAARKGLTVKYWHVTPTPTPSGRPNPYSVSHKIQDLLPLITAKTRLVAFSACSNLLGTIVPVKEVVKAIREKAKEVGAPKVEVCVDCVAFAPHRKVKAVEWDVDYCVFSFYKVYGPHTAALYVRSTALQSSVGSLAHHFLDVPDEPYKLQPGGPGYELVYGSTGIVPYLLSLENPNSAHENAGKTEEDRIDAVFDAIADHEQELLKVLLGYLTADKQYARGVRIVGEEGVGTTKERVPTVSFVVVGDKPLKSRTIVDVFDRAGGVGIRWGHFYAYTLVDELRPKLDVNDGVVRISLVHYNTTEEVDRIIEILKGVLA
ncbi:selenocysteine lyase [Pluteus cervinus]|uniref:Selenocysteine lyase n=1 Tax=Pluteus cervinus TaxID=181527 RepID=A0ACD3AJ10_9AGAR|nr:selenocysteine lyase [Pluteus cervinus]